MGPRCDPPTPTFPYMISKRLNVMSYPRPWYTAALEGPPSVTPRGVRISAVQGHYSGSDRANEAALPFLRRLLLTKRMYKHMFSTERLERMDRLIEMANATPYAKLAKTAIDLKTKDNKDMKKKKGWSETDWKKHMEYINQIANPRRNYTVDVPRYGEKRKLEQLLPRINIISMMPENKVYRRPSQESNYRDPTKVQPNALKYVISDRVKILAKPREVPAG